ncbi:MAG: cobalamin-binding protein [Sphingobacteriales bacterium]|nr:MAG: cobalamin-binding protein [Sphingobacteriales bacterium]
MDKKKIVSLLPSATEIICALGLQDSLVGRSHECDYPESVKELPICSNAKFVSGNHSNAINQQVKQILSDELSIYTINNEVIKNLNPDFIITQNQCNVCAVSLNDVETEMQTWAGNQTQLIALSPNNLYDVFNDIKTLATYLGVENEGQVLIESLEERIDLVKHKLKFFPDKPTVVCIEWLSPMMVAGNWVPQMVDIAGGKPILAENGIHSPFINWEAIVAQNPDIILIMPCGFTIARTLQEIDLLLTLPDWSTLNAVKNNRVYIADGNAYFNRSGPRLVDSVEILAEIINPKYLNFGYEGQGWIKFES